jgi:UDP-N-acetylglucosamine 2-epimerase (non-hydrolysing)
MGTNIIAGKGKEAILRAYRFSPEKRKDYTVPPLWDGRAARRVWEVLLNGNAGKNPSQGIQAKSSPK